MRAYNHTYNTTITDDKEKLIRALMVKYHMSEQDAIIYYQERIAPYVYEEGCKESETTR